ncbi:uncharacterized protein N7469_000283 [Penicillium citrinum]|uniref:Uncharacterized protein n=1 Tax=Penicillium citrinum TaxID=5077 RepID=A0A9W9PCM2_PENCI|nr:uncharacterized protein N7469_000283 [Penicillium citrinum]KAJ5241956.1 hypothetical protein N7469_000283 [Penicillium citrinum]
MAKAKGMKEGKNAKSHLKARMGFLEKAANYLQAAKTTGKNIDEVSETDETSQMSRNADYTSTKENAKTEVGTRTPRTIQAPSSNLSRVYISQMYGISLKTLTRLPIQTKRVVKPPLSSGTTCTIETQNASRGRKKPWADVMVIRCLVCGTEKRFPETGRRSQKLLERRQLIQRQTQAQAQEQAKAETQNRGS